jgi:hypothetical protein
MRPSSASTGRLVAGAAIIAAAQERGLTMPPQNASRTVRAGTPQRTTDIDQPVAAVSVNTAAQPPQPLRRDPDRYLKFSDLLRGLKTTCEAFGEPPRPLAIGIDKQIAELVGDQFARPVIVSVLRWWTGRPDYLRAVIDGTTRFNLDGSPAGEISPTHHAVAEQRLAEWQRRKAEERRRPA